LARFPDGCGFEAAKTLGCPQSLDGEQGLSLYCCPTAAGPWKNVHARPCVGLQVKMSKSLGNVVVPDDLADKYGVDPVRYFLLRDGGLETDGDFSHDMLVKRLNSDLADTLGNLGTLTFLRDVLFIFCIV
jgi:leucyl-tRNA synthetase